MNRQSSPRSPKAKTWTPEAVESHYQRQGRQVPAEVLQALKALGLENRLRSSPAVPTPGSDAPSPPTKRKGVPVAPILASLRSSLVYAHASPGPALSLWFDGARLLTANELFSIFQYRKHDTFAYKKAWKKLVARAAGTLPAGQLPYFDGPTRLWLYRRGKRLVDLDSLPVMFKYAIDALRAQGIIPDDNPEVIVEPRLIQERGLPSVGIRLERLPQWKPVETHGLREQWLGLPQPPGP